MRTNLKCEIFLKYAHKFKTSNILKYFIKLLGLWTHGLRRPWNDVEFGFSQLGLKPPYTITDSRVFVFDYHPSFNFYFSYDLLFLKEKRHKICKFELTNHDIEVRSYYDGSVLVEFRHEESKRPIEHLT